MSSRGNAALVNARGVARKGPHLLEETDKQALAGSSNPRDHALLGTTTDYPPATDAKTRGEKAKWMFDTCPRWLSYSGLPQALRATRWVVFRQLVVIDHQTLRLPTRRSGPEGRTFAAPQADLIAATGLGERAVRDALKFLRQTELIIYYKPGAGHGSRGGYWSRFRINTKTLEHLYRYVAPLIRPIHGGLAGADRAKLPEAGIQLYGHQDKLPVVLPWPTVYALLAKAEAGGEPDQQEVARICGLLE